MRIRWTRDSGLSDNDYSFEVVDAEIIISSSALPAGAATALKQLADNHQVTVSNPTADPETGLATSAKQLADNHNVTVSNPTADPETGLATSAKQLADGHNVVVTSTPATPTGTNVIGGSKFVDENGVLYGVKHIGNKPRIVNTNYLYAIAEGDIAGHERIHLIGRNPDVDAAYETLWNIGGLYVPPSSAMQLEAVSSNDVDAGVVIKSGTSDSITLLAGVLTLTDTGVDFTSATAVVAGDCLLLDGDSVHATILTVAANVITAEHDYDEFETSVQDYRIVDNSTGGTGVKVMSAHFLDNTYAEFEEFIVLNGTTAVTTVATNILRVNDLHTVFAGTGTRAVGNIDIRHLTDTPIYRRLLAGFNVDACIFFTVPLGKTAYAVRWTIAQGFSTVNRYAEARLTATCDTHGHYLENIFNTKAMALIQDGAIEFEFNCPLKFPAKADIKIDVSCPDTNAVCVGSIAGWIE